MQRDSDGTSSSELRVLVAEGSVMGRKLVARQLKKLGACARVVGTGHEAVEQARSNRFDVVLLECQLPGLDGPSAAQQIRSLSGRRGSVPIVAMSTCPESEAVSPFWSDVLAKPYQARELGDVISRYVADTAPDVTTDS